MSHTPVPWEPIGPYAGGGWNVSPGEGRATIHVPYDGGMAEANARLIARAVNAHDELLAACKRLLDESPFVSDADNCECGDGNGRDEAGNVCEHIQGRRAIAKAEGRPNAS